MTYLLLHGRGNQAAGPKSAFFPKLRGYIESLGHQVLAPNLKYANGVTLENCLLELNQTLNGINELSVLGHSSGGYLACQLAMRHKIDKLILIAPTCPTAHFSDNLNTLVHGRLQGEKLRHYQNFHQPELDLEKLFSHVQHVELWFGARDEAIDKDIRSRYASKFANTSSLQLHILPDRGHMGVDEGVTQLPEIYPFL